jgi:hemin uptake protein HemP
MSFHGPMTERPDPTAQMPANPDLPIYDARRLVGADKTAVILLDGKAYTLRITRAGKLILTK